jgi:hypothetical protein
MLINSLTRKRRRQGHHPQPRRQPEKVTMKVKTKPNLIIDTMEELAFITFFAVLGVFLIMLYTYLMAGVVVGLVDVLQEGVDGFRGEDRE